MRMIAMDISGEPIPTRGFKPPQRSEKGPRQMPEPQRPPPPPPAAERIIRKLEVEKPATFITGRAAVRPGPTPARPPDYVVRQVAPVRPPDRVVTQRVSRPVVERRRGLPKPQPQQPKSPLEGVAAALGQVGRTIQSGISQIGGVGAWAERQQERLFAGEVTPKTVLGTVASFLLPTTLMQAVGGRKNLAEEIRKPEGAISVGADVLTLMPIAGGVAKLAKAGAKAVGKITAREVSKTLVKPFVAGRAAVAPAPAIPISVLVVGTN
ncbi:MAG: hypothetical protein OWQ51_03275 [Pyrobaculum arsenaticum]|uniref:hypothetical protein n=1 Tax=Pyrobaculum arsenaticum TaxID=121277 RepID=UPI0022727437|nr:hypothetical protein [Pyrobaculum arsenaticum]